MKTMFFLACSVICFSHNLYSSETYISEVDFNSFEYSYQWTSFETSVSSSSISMYRSNTCPNSLPFCTSDSYNFPASTNVPNMGSVGCLSTTPNPAWYWMEIANSGNIDIRISSGGDVDFIAWGPFTSLSAACASDLMSNPGVDCSYSTAAQETVNIVGAVTGQVYVLLITNYANITTNISFQQIGGNGTTNCGIIAPPISNNGPLCEGDTLNLIVTNPTPGATYSWTGPGNWSSNVMNPSIPNITVAQAGSYSMTITVGTQVSPPVSTQVSVYPIPDVSISATDTTICIGESTSLNATGSPSFVWSGGLGTNNPIVVSPTITTSYMVTGTANGCSNSDTITIYVVPKPTVTNVSILDDYCSSNTGQISFSHTGGTPPILIDWDTTPPSQDTIITNLPAGSYTLTITDSNLCSYTASYQIISIAGPTISNSSVTNATCNQPNGGVNIVINTTQNLTYQWSTSPPQTSQNISGVSAGQYTVTVTDEHGCTVTASYTVGNTSGPSITNSNLIHPTCGNSNGSASVTTTGGTAPITYSWNTTPPQNTSIANNLAPGSYTVIVSDISGCTATATYTLLDIAAPQITQLIKVDETCSASNGSATVSYTGGTPPVNIIWTTSPPQNTPAVNNLPAGTYTVTLRDANNCSATQTVIIENFASPQIDGFTSQNEMCDEQNGFIEVNYTGGTAPINFIWNTVPVQNAQTAVDLVGGDYSVTITDVNGCSTLGFWSIINHPKPTSQFTNIYMDTCIVGAGKVSAFPSGGSGIYSYVWNTIPTQNSQSATGLYPGIYTVIINDGFCTITDSIEIVGIPGPDAAFITDPSLVTMRDPTVRFTDQTDGNIVGWNWFFGDGFHSNAQDPTHIYYNVGEYNVFLVVTDANGCTDTASGVIIVDVDFGIWIPNAFTPNEDGKNERFGPKAIGFSENGYSMKIFDRWGKLVFETTDYYTQWDGRDSYSGMQRDVLATYVYEIIIVDNVQKSHRFHGKISVIY